jgi:hypothetical protein
MLPEVSPTGLHADDDLLPNGECIDVRRRLGNNSGSLLTDDEWKRRAVLILALNHQKSGKLMPDALSSTRTISGASGACGSRKSWRHSGGPSSLQTTAR